MSYWKQFAKMLGLELEQEFVLTDVDGNRIDDFTYTITEDGLLYRTTTFNWEISSLRNIGKLLDGDVKAVPKPWKPKKGERFWAYLYGLERANSTRWDCGTYDLLLWKAGNCFRTEKEASTKGKEIMEQIQKEYEEA